ncbi:hypothetical protein UCRPC4_g01193 [Phaeomoniella chlamydospora]|uniref:Uncharacterized protein n=1 Tax=Phaeomoniella chlamydospora TaxID=158046 RepID=A0A0G2EYR2_PHACM|nr:hypothetical protein UCRPC4_g01193 [Phaeomoniella chlamydospora]
MDTVVKVLELERRNSISSEQPTLAGSMQEEELDPKTPTVGNMPSPTGRISQASTAPVYNAGPLEQQLQALLSKVTLIERERPTIMADDYKELQDRLVLLEAEKATWKERHEALFALRDEDLANLIKIRCLLADERREHAAMRKLRDGDIHNVIELREKLANATWTKPAELTRASSRQSRPEGSDLWQAAKSAAMEQRVLELENHNEELLRKLETKSDWGHIEVMLDENIKYRERMGQKVQQLRSEKEALQKELSRFEDLNAELEVKLSRSHRRGGL